MAKFDKSREAQQTQKEPVTPPAASSASTDPALIVTQNNDMQRDFQDITSDTDKPKDIDKPVVKDYDYADHANMVGGSTRQFMSDGLTRQLNCTMYILDVVKDWGNNPLGGRPVPVSYSREFPEIRVLYDTFGQSPETATQEMVTKIVEFKRKLAHDHGYRYLFQHNWQVLTSDNLTKQLNDENAWLRTYKK